MRRLALALLFSVAAPLLAEPPRGIENPLHGYYTQPTHDRFAPLKAALESGRETLPGEGELPVLQSLLHRLEIPVSSQMLVSSVTSLQKALISPRRPRALYFNDDTYVGFVPGGRIEVISLDPTLGSIYYIFDRFTGAGAPRITRSEECMNCHAPHTLGSVPALALESVVPGLTGGGERAFRRGQTGHGIPLSERFGGWLLTGAGPNFPKTQANLLIEYRDGLPHERPITFGELFDPQRYLRPTSDLLPQLLQEHQVGFVNRALVAAYRTRELLSDGAEHPAEITELARPLIRYLLFADEAPLPPGSVLPTPEYTSAFQQNRRPASNGAALKDLDLQTGHLFKNRCSYLIYTPLFTALPPPLKTEVLIQMRAALTTSQPEFAYLSPAEKITLHLILTQTLENYRD